jgi:hypothetical protein
MAVASPTFAEAGTEFGLRLAATLLPSRPRAILPCRTMMSRASGRCAFALLVCAACAAPLDAQDRGVASPPQVMGTETTAEFWYERETNTGIDSNKATFGDAPYHITFSITFPGLRQPEIPGTVEVQLVREVAPADEAPDTRTPPVIIIIDGLRVPLTRQTGEAPDTIKGIVSFEVFQWMVGGTALEFEVFGRHLVLVPRQVSDLRTTALEWAHPLRK